jgi:prevent-host-death family protein
MTARTVSIYEAKTHLSRLVAQVEQGEEIEITRHGRPVARLVPPPPRPKRRLGLLEGQGFVPDGWDELTEEELADWYGE